MRERNQQVNPYLRKALHFPIWTLLIPLFILLSASSSFAQPANDDCNSATPVPTDGTCIDGNNTLATPDVGNGSCVTNGGTAPNVWFSFVADGTDYDIDAFGLGGSAEITLIQFMGAQCDFSSAVEIDCGIGNINGTGLTAGQQYFVSITSSNGSEGNFSICVDNPATAPPPPNDDPCSPTPIPADGSCTTGTTEAATQDWSNPNCPNLGTSSVWYQVTLSGTNNSLDITIGNQTISGEVSIMVGTFTPDCTGGFGFVEQYCGPPMTTFTAAGLTPGSTYWIVVSTDEIGEGIFDICVTESGPPPACAVNDLCSDAIDISGAPAQQICIQGCNTGVGPDATGGSGCFDFSAIPTVWYTFTTDGNTAGVTLTVGSPSFDQPQIALFEGPCPGTPVDCNLGSGGSVALNNVTVMPNTTYLVAVGSIGGQEGDFTVCGLYIGAGGTNCVTSGEVEVLSCSLGSPLSGPFQPNETVNMCFNIDWSSTGNNCQWLHGVVPEFGDCWSPISFGADGMPNNVTVQLPNAQWYADGDVVYNDLGGSGALPPGAPTGAGWYVVGVNNNGNLPLICGPNDWQTDPNCSFGIPMGCNSASTYQICFDLVTKSFAECDGDASAIDCGVSFKTYGDGETGGWSQPGCEADIPIFGNYSLNCCIGPEMLFLPQTVCSDEQFDIFLDDFLLPPTQAGDVSYTWTVSAPAGVNGASDCPGACGVILSQILTNTTGSPQIVTYTITPRSLDGCLGLPYDLQITVLPEIVANIDNPTGAVCSGGCVNLFASASGGNPGYFYEWDNGDVGITTEVCPTFTTMYMVTVTDANGCTGVESITVEANPNLAVDIFVVPDVTNTPDYIEMCDQDPTFPLTLSAFADLGGPGWIYNWDLASGANSPSPFVQATQTGIYYVTLTDANGCTGESEIEVVIHPSPTIILFPAGPFCEGDPAQSLTVVTIPSGGMGTWIGNFDGNGDFVPDIPGPNTVYYEYEDANGCTNIDSMVIQVDPVPDPPTWLTNPSPICNNDMNVTFCVEMSAAETYCVWQWPQGVIPVTNDSSACITLNWNNAGPGEVCVAAGNDCGESAFVCEMVDVIDPPTIPTGLAGPEMPCENETGLVYTIDPVANATGYTWIVTGGTITAGQGTTSITVSWGTDPGTVCVAADNSCGSSGAACLNISPIATPDAPVLTNPGAVCAGETGVVYTIADVPGATTYNWTVPTGATFTGQGTTSITVDFGSATGGQICVNAENSCGTSPDACITLTIDTPPTLTGPIIGPDVVCANDQGVAYSIAAATGATSYSWVITGGTLASGGSTNNITIDWGTGPTGTICVTGENNCGSSNPPVCVNITIDAAPTTPTPPADGTVCEGTVGDVYSIPAVAGATTYNWTVPAPATFTGQGTTSIVVDWGATSAPASICVSAENNCGTSPDACFTITPTLIPTQPGPITGPADPCNGSTGIAYSIADVPGATNYNWTVPAGATFTGQGTSAILVDWGLSAGGQICVNAQNACGTSPDQCFMVMPFGPPTLAGPLAGPTNLCANSSGVVYSVPSAPGADSYTWVITGGTQASGGTTNSITVDWGAGPTGEVCVTANNVCGASAPLCITVTIDQVPASPTPPADDIVCAGDMGVVYSIPAIPGATSYNWTFPTGTVVSGNGSNTVSVNWGNTGGQVCVNSENNCGTSTDACFMVTVNDVPALPTGLNGNTLLCQDVLGETYSIDPVAGATSYVWTVGGSGTIVSGQGSTSINVDWGNAGGDVCVYAVNDCGSGPEACLPVSIDLILAPPSISCGVSTTTSVIFNWSHPTATEYSYTYTINGGAIQGPFTTTDNSVTIPGLSANDEVIISIVALGGMNVCGDSPAATQPCTANDCNLNPPSIDNIATEYCVNETGITFTATPAGGSFSGPGVSSDGSFDPSGLPAGPIVVTYEYTDADGCPQAVSETTTIVTPIVAPTITCNGSNSTEVSFLWSHPTATMYEYYYTVNGGPPTPITATNLTDLTIPGLNEGDDVELFVIAIGGPPCGNSIAGSRICEVQVCQDTPPLINDINDPYCENDNSLIVFTGVPSGGTFSGAGIDTDGTFHPDQLPVGLNPITYSYTDNIGCVQSNTVDVEVVGILVPPTVSCGTSTQSSVTFNWFHPDPAVTTFVFSIGINGPPTSPPVTTNDQTYEVTGLNANDVVTISVIAVGINACGDSEATIIDCTADNCQNNPPTLPIDPLYCITDAPVQLMASAGSGTYTGSPGISMSGLWSPAAAGVGPASITYEYTDAFDCVQSVTVMTEVVDIIPAPLVTCQGSTTSDVTFLVSSGATDFEYTYTVNGGPVQGPFTTSMATINIAGLAVDDVVDISVVAVGSAPCGNSAPGTGQCTAQSCVDNPPTIDNLDLEYCITQTGILLTGTPTGGTFSIAGTQITGLFNPADYSAGSYTITYSYIDSDGCTQSISAPTTIIDQPQGPGVSCLSSTVNSVSFDWDDYPGATGYTYTYTIDGGAVQGPFTTTDSSVDIPGLTANQIVEISVVATGLSPCTESLASTAQCEAKDCAVTIDIDPVPDFCLDGSSSPVTLSVVIGNTTNTGSGVWSGNCLTGPDNNIFDPTLCGGAGIQNITYTYDEDGCNYTDILQINVFGPPVAEAGPPVVLTCDDGEKELDGTGSMMAGATYLWTGPGVIVNETSLTPTVNAIGLFTLTVTSAEGCTATDDVMVSQDGDIPVVSPGANQTLTCDVDEVFLNVTSNPSSDITYTWTGPDINAGNQNDASPGVTLPGDYFVTIQNNLNGCTSPPVMITVDEQREAPQVILVNPSDTLDCIITSLTFDICTPQAGFDNTNWVYQWFNGGVPVPNANDCTITIETPGGVYTYEILDTLTGCSTTGTVEAIDAVNFPLADAGSGGTLDCATDLITLVGGNTQVGPGIVYQWTGPPGGIQGDDTGISVDVVLPGTYTIEVTDVNTGCANQSEAIVIEDQNAPIADGGPDQELDCDFTPIDLDGSGSTASGTLIYQWLDETGGSLGQNSSIQVDAPGVYALAIEDIDNGCVDTTFVLVSPNSNAPQDAILDIQDPECFGDEDGFINVVEIVGGTPPYNYSFDGQTYSSNPFITNLPPGVYPINVEDAAGCQWSTQVTVAAPSEIGFDLGIDVELQMGEDAIINAGLTLDDSEIESIDWTPLDLIECLDTECRSVLIDSLFQTTTVRATVVDTNGCVAQDDVQLRVKKDRLVYIPSGFSPNGDGANDLFVIQGGQGVEKINYFRIYDRWGEVVYRAANFDPNDPNFGWDGTLKGQKMNPAVFVYHAEVLFIDGHIQEYTGDVTLIR